MSVIGIALIALAFVSFASATIILYGPSTSKRKRQ